MLDHLLHRFLQPEEPLSTRRQLLANAALDGAVVAGLSVLLQSSPTEAATTKKLGNYPIMDMDGKYRDYSQKAAPIIDVPATEIHKYPAGILNYLEWEGNPRAGKSALIQFGSHWCGPCDANMPFLEQIYKNPQYRHLQMLGVNMVDEDELLEEAAQKTNAKIKKNKVTYPNLLMHANPLAAALMEHIPEGSHVPQILLVGMPSAQVVYRCQYLFELGNGKILASDIGKLYREIEKVLSKD